jgi:hypothetical protein
MNRSWPVSSSVLILIMVSLGMGRGLSQGYAGSKPRSLGPNVGFLEGLFPSNHDAGSGSRTHAKETMHALL